MMKVLQRVDDVRSAISQNKKGRVGFVPTMGALHSGHISLVERCRQECGCVVVSIFVNPTQFNDKNDLKNYPRTMEADLAMLEKAGVDIVFTPTEAEIYPEVDTREFNFGATEQVMEGLHRKGHFNGVAQVVSKLFDIVQPDAAYFGEKDFQQLAIIRLLVKQLGYNIEIVGCPIERDSDGLALSSRNTLLNPAQRSAAPEIYKSLCKAAEAANSMSVAELKRMVVSDIDKNTELETEYFEIVDAETLQPIDNLSDSDNAQGCVAVKVGAIRLIDNIRFK